MNENSIPSKVKKVKIPFLAWDECDGDVTYNAIRNNCPLLESSFLLLLTRGAAFDGSPLSASSGVTVDACGVIIIMRNTRNLGKNEPFSLFPIEGGFHEKRMARKASPGSSLHFQAIRTLFRIRCLSLKDSHETE